MQTFQLWVEGYQATGDSSRAQLAATVEAESFQAACDKFFTGKAASWGNYDPAHRSVWSCRIFDNEADARKGFG